MNKLIVFLGVLLTVLTGCTEAKKLTQFDLPVNQEFTLPASPVILTDIPFTTPEFETNYLSYFETFNINTDLVESIGIKSVDFNITAPETGDFSFLQSVEVYISAEGLNQVLLASKKNITNAGKTLSLDVDSKVDLKKYVTKNNIKLNLIVSTTKTTTTKYTIDTKLVFLVDANVMGL